MNQPTDLSTQLRQFADAQLHSITPGKITRVTVHLILTTAFFSGALLSFAKAQKRRKADYLPILIDFLADTFSLSHENAAGMVESNARMYKRYVLVETIYQQGWEAAQQWPQDKAANSDKLCAILHRYQQLSMSGLNIDGIKEIPQAPTEVEALIPVIESAAVARKCHWPWWLALLLLAASLAIYFFFFR